MSQETAARGVCSAHLLPSLQEWFSLDWSTHNPSAMGALTKPYQNLVCLKQQRAAVVTRMSLQTLLHDTVISRRRVQAENFKYPMSSRSTDQLVPAYCFLEPFKT
jgi:hypothetical protein